MTGAATSIRPGLAGVVLCGGGSVRMGRDKASLELDGETLLQRAVRRLASVCDPVMIAPGANRLRAEGCIVVDDARAGAGPLGGLTAALRVSPQPLLAAVAVDMPWFDPALLRLLADRCAGHDAAVPCGDRGAEPLHAVYGRGALDACDAALRGGAADRSLRGLLQRIDTMRMDEAEWRRLGVAPGFAANLNAPEDLLRLRRRTQR